MLAKVNKLFRYDLWTLELDRLAPWERLGVRLLRLVIVAGLEFRENILSTRATSLVYTTTLSLVPLLAVMFSVLKAFGVHQQIQPFLAQVLEPLGERGHEVTIQIIGFVNNLKVGVLGTVGVATLFWTTFSAVDQIENALNTIWLRSCNLSQDVVQPSFPDQSAHFMPEKVDPIESGREVNV